MRLIAHRGLLYGPDPQRENTIGSIELCLKLGLDVEIDIWYEKGWFLGHDAPATPVSDSFLTQPGLWIHAKNMQACEQLPLLSQKHPSLNYFWVEDDSRVLTSQGQWWSSPRARCWPSNSVAVMPEWHISLENLHTCLEWNTMAICTDWISLLSPIGIQ